MRISEFQFSNPVLLAASFSVNEQFDAQGCNVDIQTSVDIQRNAEKNEAYVVVTVNLGDQENAPFFVSVKEQALFHWGQPDDPVVAEDDPQLKTLLEQNAPALLIGYIRPVITFLTSNSPYPPFHLPFMNLASE